MVKLLLLLLCLAPCASAREARRVVSLMPSYTEIVYALGAGGELAGVSNFCDWPPEAAKVERAGDYLRPDLEKVYALKPDLVLAGAWSGGATVKKLSALGLKVVTPPEERRVEDIYATIRLLARELGRKAEGEALVKKLAAQLPAAPGGEPVKVYLEADAGGWTMGRRSFLTDAVRLAGGRQIFAGEDRAYFQASWEETLLLDPEAVILLAGNRDEFLARPMAGGLAAVKAGRVITSLDRDAFSRPGPRLFGEIKKLKELLRGEK